MGDNDFTAGDPWGLPIEDSEEIELGAARPEPAEPEEPDADDHFEPVPDAGIKPEAPFGAVAEGDTHDARDGATDDLVEPGADEVETDAWMPASDASLEPEDEAEAAPDEHQDSVPESSDSEEDEYTFKAPSRTPLSQMIAAAQSVVSSVQGDGEDEHAGSEETDGLSDETPAIDEVFTPEQPLADLSEPTGMVASSGDQTAREEDLPEEPPSWMIVDSEPDLESPTSVDVTEELEDDGSADDYATFTPLEIEASIADLATPETPEAPFAEDHFEMVGEEASSIDETADGVDVDYDSSPGVYSELHDLNELDAQAESLLQEAAAAFGRTDETTTDQPSEEVEGLPEDLTTEDLDSYADALATGLTDETTTDQPTEEVEDLPEDLTTEDLDSYADALATGLTDETTTDQPTEEVEDLPEDLTTEDLDSYADALATGLTDETTTDQPTEEVEDLPEDLTTEDLDSYADALATGLTDETTTDQPTEEVEDLPGADSGSFIDGGTTPYMGEDELGAALAGLADSVHDDGAAEADEPEPETSDWWSAESRTPSDQNLADEAIEVDGLDTEPGPEETADPASPGWWSAEPDTPSDDIIGLAPEAAEAEDAHGADEAAEARGAEGAEKREDLDETVAGVEALAPLGSLGDSDTPDADVDAEDHETAEPATVVDSPVEWGVRYREAHQGWVEDDEGRSTWRPIVTSGESVAGWDIDIYLGLVSGDISIDRPSPGAVASEVAAAREGAVRRMLDEGLARGAHAIVGVTFTLEDVAGVVLVGASGVAVTLRTPA